MVATMRDPWWLCYIPEDELCGLLRGWAWLCERPRNLALSGVSTVKDKSYLPRCDANCCWKSQSQNNFQLRAFVVFSENAFDMACDKAGQAALLRGRVFFLNKTEWRAWPPVQNKTQTDLPAFVANGDRKLNIARFCFWISAICQIPKNKF